MHEARPLPSNWGPAPGGPARSPATLLDNGRVALDLAARQLRVHGEPAKLGSRAFDLLVALVERRERLVSKQELLELVWPGLVVEENNLQVHVMALRKLLGAQAISTVPGRGYRFTAQVDAGPDAAATALARVGGADDAVADLPGPGQAMQASAPTTTRLIGRDADAAALEALVKEHRLVSVIGAGGVGKSSLARRVLGQTRPAWPHGVAWLDLSALAEAPQVVDAIAASLGLGVAGADARRALAAVLKPYCMLVVLDNAEHLVDEVAAVAAALLAEAPGVHLMVTSQVPLKLGVECLFRVDPLPLPEADSGLDQARGSPPVQLLVERVRAVDRHFVLDPHNLAAIVRTVRRLDGLPLAIEMAAARLPMLGAARLDTALEERFEALASSERATPARQRTLRAAMEWTHGLLGAAEQRIFRRLAVFAGSFGLDAAQAVAAADVDGPWAFVDALSVLVERSLVVIATSEPPRYRLLDTPRAYALECLQAASEEADIRRRHALALRALFEGAAAAHDNGDLRDDEWRAVYLPDLDNANDALAWALVHDGETAVAIAPGLGQALTRSPANRIALWNRTAPLLAGAAALPPLIRARWLCSDATFWAWNKPARSAAAAREAVQLFRQLGDRRGEYRALAALASSGADVASPEAVAAAAAMDALQDPRWPLTLLRLRPQAAIAAARGHVSHERLIEMIEALAALDRMAGREGMIARHIALIHYEVLAGKYEAAIARGARVRQRIQASGSRVPSLGTDMYVLLALLHQGDRAQALVLAPEIWSQSRLYEYHAPIACALALLAAQEGRAEDGARLLGYAERAFERLELTPLAPWRQACELTLSILRQAIDGEALRRAQEEGTRLGDDEVSRVAFGRGRRATWLNAAVDFAPPESDGAAALNSAA